MGKKYLSIEEAARILGVDPKQLNRMREKGEIRAFADRGTWKFRQDDIEELSRTQLPDSNPEVPLGNYAHPGDLSSEVVLGGEDLSLGEQPTIIRRGSEGDPSGSDVPLRFDEDLSPASSGMEDDLHATHEPPSRSRPGSDSDVRLVLDDSLQLESDAPVAPLSTDSDSDVQLVGSDGAGPSAEESGIALLGRGSDSDVQLVGGAATRDERSSDSDVKLVTSGAGRKPQPPRDSEISDSDVALINRSQDDDDEILSLDVGGDDEGSFVLGGKDSGIFSGGPSDSGIALDLDAGDTRIGHNAGESGIALAGDSGIALEGESGIALDAGESGIALDFGDSGIALAGESGYLLGGESGIALDKPAGDPPGKKKSKDDDLSGTIPMMPAAGPDSDLLDTQMEVPLLAGDDSDFEFSSSALDEDSSTNVISLEGEDPADEYGATMVGKTSHVDEDLADSVFDEADDDVVYGDDEELEVADDLLGEDDELGDDVFGVEDDDFDDDLQTGQSHADFVAPIGRVSAPVEAEWGAGTFAGLSISTIAMCLTGWVMYDLVRTMWTGGDPTATSNALLDMFRGMFGT